jgi:hypothetical protein
MQPSDTRSDLEAEMVCLRRIVLRLREIINLASGVPLFLPAHMRTLRAMHSDLNWLYSILATFYPNVTDQEDSPAVD